MDILWVIWPLSCLSLNNLRLRVETREARIRIDLMGVFGLSVVRWDLECGLFMLYCSKILIDAIPIEIFHLQHYIAGA